MHAYICFGSTMNNDYLYKCKHSCITCCSMHATIEAKLFRTILKEKENENELESALLYLVHTDSTPGQAELQSSSPCFLLHSVIMCKCMHKKIARERSTRIVQVSMP